MLEIPFIRTDKMEEICIINADWTYPVLMLPKRCTSLQSNHGIAENVYIHLKIISDDKGGNEMCIYSGLCNVKVIDIISDINANIAECYPDAEEFVDYNKSEVWIDPARSPYVYNSSTESDDSSLDQQNGYNITIEQSKTYVTQNGYNFEEQNEEYIRYQKNLECQEFDEMYNSDELECGFFLTQLPGEILNEKEIKAREEMRYADEHSDAIKQLLSSENKLPPKPQRTILFLGEDSNSGETIHNIASEDTRIECADKVDVGEAVVENTSASISEGTKRKYQCDKCKQIFDRLEAFKSHKKATHRRRKTQEISEKENKQNQNKKENNQILYKCDECGKSMKNHEKFMNHCKSHGDPELECQVCRKVYATKFTLRNHMKIHERQYRCSYCTKSYEEKEGLCDHSERAHGVFLCERCHFQTNRYPKLVKHRLNCNKDQNSTDEACHDITDSVPEEAENTKDAQLIQKLILADEIEGLIYSQKSDSDTITISDDFVIDEESSKSEEVEKAESVIATVISDEIFLKRSRRAGRKNKHNKTCAICRKNFDRISDLKRHLIEHIIKSTLTKIPVSSNRTLSIECEVCHVVSFSKIDKYKAHLREHAKLTLYKCTFCDKSFSDSSNFSKHKKIHASAEALYHCDLCQRKFNSKNMISRHMEYHNKNPPIRCPHCVKKFHFQSTLNKHIKLTHLKEPMSFKCTFCHDQFDTSKEKWDHEWLFHSVRKTIVDCTVCGLQFRKYTELKKHCLKVHDLEIPRAKDMHKLRMT